MSAGDDWQATLTRRLGRAVFVSLVLHVGILALLGWVRLPRQGERPLTSIEISLASLPTLPAKSVEPPKPQPVKKEVERSKVPDKPKPVEQLKRVEQPRPIEQPKPIEQSKPIEPPKQVEQSPPVEQPKPAPPVNVAPAPPPVPSAKQSNDIMRDVLKDIELPPDAPKFGEISPEENPKKAPVIKLPDVPVVAETKEAVGKQAVIPPSSSLTEELAKELDEELKKIKKLELAKQEPPPAPPVEAPVKPSPRVEAKAPSLKTVDTTLKIPGMVSGSNAYLALVRQRISNVWSAPPVDVTNQVYVVIVQFRLHRNGRVTGVAIEQSSGNEYYDLAGKRAVLNAVPLPVFPADITDAYLDAHFTFTVGEPEG
ncbi:MAG: cell envelope integrity protein TolA [Nitrospira sp.]|nr:cell envelope integrity protein TolA [Nitrospira sp.]